MTDISQTFPAVELNGPIVGDQQLKTRKVSIPAGNVISAFTVVGHQTSTDTYVTSLTASTDGSQVPAAILAYDVDTTAGATVADAYFEGEFGDRLLVYGTGHSAATVEAAFRTTNTDIFIRALPILG